MKHHTHSASTPRGREQITALLDGEPMEPVDVDDESGTWTRETDAGPVRVTLAWSADRFTHASALVGPDQRLVTLDFESPDTSKPVFVPTDDRHTFEVELVYEDSPAGGETR